MLDPCNDSSIILFNKLNVVQALKLIMFDIWRKYSTKNLHLVNKLTSDKCKMVTQSRRPV